MTKARQKKRKNAKAGVAPHTQSTPPEALLHLGNTLREQGKPEAALDCFAKALQVRPIFPEAYVGMGTCWRDMQNPQQAIACFERALAQRPEFATGLGCLGAALWSIGSLGEARIKLEHAMRIEPSNPELITALGSLAFAEGKVQEALDYFNQVLAVTPGYTSARFNKSYALLALGMFAEGWKLYEEGIGHSNMRPYNPFAGVKAWDGKPIPEQHLLIWAEQGLGDSLQFIRYAELCRQRVGKLSVLCQKPLVRLFKTFSFIDDAFDASRGGDFHADQHISMMSLPLLFGTTLETVPASVPYLRPDPASQAKWAVRFADARGLKVGLVWAGGSHEGVQYATLMDRQRSVALERLKPWLSLQGAQFYSLQKDKPAGQIAELGLTGRITDFMSEVMDFADTAAIVQNLDLVITVDTSVAHLAGGLGKPVWILSRYNADWRWLQNRPTNPWYPTARIFGQPTMGDWDSVIDEVGRELEIAINN